METVLKPKKPLSWDDAREFWRYRELLYFFTWRDLKVRYKQTAIGVAWAILQPFITMVVFTIFFGKLLNIPSDNIPYPIFVYIGLLFWQFFSTALSETSNSLINNQAIITKIYFPRLILPVSIVLTKLVDFFIATVVLAGLMVYYSWAPHLLGIVLVPLLLFITFMAATGAGLLLASINVKYRDVRYALPFFIQLLLFVTPVIYPASIAGSYAWLLALNPMTGVIQTARGSLLGTEPINWLLLGVSCATMFVLFVVGVLMFKKVERYFADIV
ncbi:MAG: ABC transporter permease [Patescibacteria group bacterium]